MNKLSTTAFINIYTKAKWHFACTSKNGKCELPNNNQMLKKKVSKLKDKKDYLQFNISTKVSLNSTTNILAGIYQKSTNLGDLG